MRARLCAAAAATVAVGLAVPATSSSASPGPIYFGAILGTTGPFSSFEAPNLQGLQAGVAVINKEGGILGRKVKLVSVNDAGTPAKVPLAVQTLLGKYNLTYLEAEVIPTFQKTILTYTDAKKIITIEPTAGPTLFTVSKNPYNFQAYPTQGPVQAAVAAFKKVSTTPKVAIINTGNEATGTQAAAEAAGAKKDGDQVVYTGQISPTATDASIQVGAAQQAGANVLMVEVGGSVCNVVTQAVQALAWHTVKVILTPGCLATSIMEAVPSTVAPNTYALAQNSYLANSKTGGPAAQFKAFVPAMKKYGTITTLGAAANLGYILDIMKYAIDKAGTTKTTAVVKVLDNMKKANLSPASLYDLPNPGWTKTDHSFDNASLSTYWALMHPGTPKTGAYTGISLKVPATTPT